MTHFFSVLITVCFIISFAYGQSGSINKIEKDSRSNPSGFVEYLPADYDPSGKIKYPVIFWLHGIGAGSVGTGSSADLDKIKDKWILNWLNDGNEIPFIVFVPQDINGFWGSGRFQAFVEWVLANYETVDSKQLHVQGQSGGGFGVRAFIVDNSDTYKMFSTFTPSSTNFSSNIEENTFQQIIDNEQYIWFHHGLEDNNAATQIFSVQRFHDNIYDIDPTRSRLTAYTSVGHSAWEEVYDNSGRNKEQLNGEVDGIFYYNWNPSDQTWYEWMLSNPREATAPDNIVLNNIPFFSGTESGTIIASIESNGTFPYSFNFVQGVGDTDNDVFLIEGNKLKINENVDISRQATYSIRLQSNNSGGSYEKEFTITVTKKDLIVTANDLSSIYGDSIPELSFSYDGFINGDNESTLEEAPIISTLATIDSDVGKYDISLTGGISEIYNFQYVNATLDITPAELIVSVKDTTMNQGDDIPVFELIYNGFKNDDGPDDLIEEPIATTSATSESAGGIYEITPSGGQSLNYSFIYENGSLTICDLMIELLFNPTDSTINVLIEGGIAPYDILWSTNENTESIKIDGIGDFDVKVEDGRNCVSSLSITIEEDDFNILGLEDNEEYYIWPNPTNQIINIKAESKIGKIKIYTPNGKEVFKRNLARREGRIDLSHLNIGTYFLIIENKKGNKSSFKFLLQK